MNVLSGTHSSTIKLTSLNLQGFVDWSDRKPKILEYLRSENPDIILFQEVVFNPALSPYNQVEELNQALGYSYEHHAVVRLHNSVTATNHREGLSVISKFPIMYGQTVILLQDPDDEHTRIFQRIDFKVSSRLIPVVNIHFSNRTTFATAQLGELLDYLEAREETPILAGDFNLIDGIPRLDQLQGYSDSLSYSKYVSYPGLPKPLDYILIPSSYEFGSGSVSPDGLSDHRALTGIIKV